MRIFGRFRGTMEKFKYSWLSAYEERVTSKQRAKQAKYNTTWDIAKARDLMNNMFNKDKIAGMVFNPNDEKMIIVMKEVLIPIMPGEKPKPEFYSE